MFCVKCGTRLEEGVQFCTFCGARVVTTPGAGTSADQGSESASQGDSWDDAWYDAQETVGAGGAGTGYGAGSANAGYGADTTGAAWVGTAGTEAGTARAGAKTQGNWSDGTPAATATDGFGGAQPFQPANPHLRNQGQQASQASSSPYQAGATPYQAGSTQQYQSVPQQEPYQPRRKQNLVPIVAAVCGTLAVVGIAFLAFSAGKASVGESVATTEAAATTQAATTEEAASASTTTALTSATSSAATASSAATSSATTAESSSVTNNTTIVINGETFSVPVQESGYVLPESDSRYYSTSELSGMSLNDLWIARNEIYARRGRGFVDEALQDYFNRQSWYHYLYSPEEFDSKVTLNTYEQTNAETIKSIEQARNSTHLN